MTLLAHAKSEKSGLCQCVRFLVHLVVSVLGRGFVVVWRGCVVWLFPDGVVCEGTDEGSPSVCILLWVRARGALLSLL